MKIISVRPVETDGIKGVVDVEVKIKYGFLWRKSRTEIWRATSRFGIIWDWVHNGKSSYRLTEIIQGQGFLLSRGKYIDVVNPIVVSKK